MTRGIVFISLQEQGKGIFWRIGRVGYILYSIENALSSSASRLEVILVSVSII